MADIAASYWGNFMRTHDPNIAGGNLVKEVPYYPAYVAKTDEINVMMGPDDIKVATNMKLDECRFGNPMIAVSIRRNFPPYPIAL